MDASRGSARAGPRAALVARVAGLVADRGATRVAVDGVDGSGKTVFAGELVAALAVRGLPAIRASIDGFHHARAVRYRQGRDSPTGYYEDSYDYVALRRALLDPLRDGGDRWVRTAIRDVTTDHPVEAAPVPVPGGAVLVVDGIFLQRPELAGEWDLTIWLDVPFAVTYARMSLRDGCPADPDHERNRRYRQGQERYLAACRPAAGADLVVDNTDAHRPRLLRP